MLFNQLKPLYLLIAHIKGQNLGGTIPNIKRLEFFDFQSESMFSLGYISCYQQTAIVPVLTFSYCYQSSSI
jgi:hypothetical protein